MGKKIKIVAIIGSIRPGNMTSKALAVVLDEMNKNGHVDVEVIDPGGLRLGVPGKESGKVVDQIQDIVSRATGIILATPEYHGSYSSTIKVVIDNLGFPSVLSGKPISLLGVASGQIGAVKALEHLRSVCSHVGAIVLPKVVSVSGVHKRFNEQGKCTDVHVEQRLRSLGTNLVEYIERHICPSAALEETVREE